MAASRDERGDAIVLVGPMGAGKTTVGRILAERLGRPFVDTDELVIERTGLSVVELFADSEQAFRDREREAVTEATTREGAVISCGGGTVLDGSSRRLLKAAGLVVFLDVDAPVAAERIGDPSSRPLLSEGDVQGVLAEVIAVRRPIYLAISDLVVDARGPADAVASKIVESLG